MFCREFDYLVLPNCWLVKRITTIHNESCSNIIHQQHLTSPLAPLWLSSISEIFPEMQTREFNKQVALFVTEKVGTMSCAYLFALIALISLPEALSSEDPLEIVSWIAETFLQLVLLSIIIVGQNIQSEIAEEQAQTDRETLVAIKKLAEEINVVVATQQKAT